MTLRDGLGQLARRLRDETRGRLHLDFALLAATLALAVSWGLWSCQSPTPVPPHTVRAATPVIERDLPTTEPDMRVRIRAVVEDVKLSGPAEFIVRAGAGESRTFSGPLTITATESGCRITDGRDDNQGITGVPCVDIDAAPRASASQAPERIKVDGVPYPGRIRVLLRSGPPVADTGARTFEPLSRGLLASVTPGEGGEGGKGGEGGEGNPRIDVLELVPLETYLAGVIVSEMPKHWPLGAFHVQAVCARTYALHERQRAIKAQRTWDLEAGEIDQAYNGGPEIPIAAKAVAETRGVVLTTEGHLLRAYYSSTCGGRTAGAASIWPTGPGFEFNLDKPIQANPREALCQGSPIYRWSVTRERAELSKQIRQWARANSHACAKMGYISSLRVDKTNEVGRPTRYIITDDEGDKFAIAAELLRVACNYTIPGVRITKETRVRSGDMEMEITPGGIVVTGRGFGHGVGMCQYCAKAMAERGDKWQDMVARFYPGAKLERAY